MWLVVGLGNPGSAYANNRHNIGFMAVDAVHSHFAFPVWRKKFQGETSEAVLKGMDDKVLLLKPQGYMNLSGASVQAAASFYKIPLSRIIVFHDDLDLAPGKVKVKTGGGAGGHNGIKSLDSHLGSDYVRVRLGIGHPGVHEPNKDALVHSHVLSDFPKADRAWLEEWMTSLAKAFPLILKGDYAGLGSAMPPKRQG
jgi:PTH1 family peptidyl-tRNA hydrolase